MPEATSTAWGGSPDDDSFAATSGFFTVAGPQAAKAEAARKRTSSAAGFIEVRVRFRQCRKSPGVETVESIHSGDLLAEIGRDAASPAPSRPGGEPDLRFDPRDAMDRRGRHAHRSAGRSRAAHLVVLPTRRFDVGNLRARADRGGDVVSAAAADRARGGGG